MNRPPPMSEHADESARPSAQTIQAWLIHQIAEELQVAPENIRLDQPILACGIDSMQVVSIVARLEDWLKIRFYGNPLEDYPTIERLSEHVSELIAVQ